MKWAKHQSINNDVMYRHDVNNMIQWHAAQIVSRYALDQADIVQDLRLALIKALPRYQPRKAAFSTFAAHVVKRAAKNIIRHHLSDINSHAGLVEQNKAIQSYIMDIPLSIDIKVFLNSLSPDLRDIAIQLVSDSPRTIARNLGMSFSLFRRTYLKKLRKQWKGVEMGGIIWK